MSLQMNSAWLRHLANLVAYGHSENSRNGTVLELPQTTMAVTMQYPVLDIPDRKMSYRFMLAEAIWMMTGKDTLQDLAKYNKRMAEFSDDGVILAGAYGPRIMEQIDYVVDELYKDPNTRRATLTTWIKNPAASKDIPCTVAMTFMIRRGMLSMHVFMRSSDAWLGVPYDVFSFSMIATLVATRYNARVYKNFDIDPRHAVAMGTLYLTAANAHLYSEHHDKAVQILQKYNFLDKSGNVMQVDERDVELPRTRLNWTDVTAGHESGLMEDLGMQLALNKSEYIDNISNILLQVVPVDRKYPYHGNKDARK